MTNQIPAVDSRNTSSDALLVGFKSVLASSNPTMTLHFWYIFTNKDFKSQITLQFQITYFQPSSKTSLDNSLWSLQVKVHNLSFNHANSIC